MKTEICENCKTRFSYEEIGGGQPFKPEKEGIKCPSCGHERKELTTGFFKVAPLPQKTKGR